MVPVSNNRPGLGPELVRDLVAELPAAVAYLSGPEHRFELANEACRRLVGGRDLDGRLIRDALPELEGQGYLELLDEALRTGERHRGRESRVVVPDVAGRPLEPFVDFVYQPVRDADGVPVGVLVQAADVTEHVRDRQRLEELTSQLRETQERSESLFRTMEQGVVYHGPDGVITAANPAAGQVLGVDPDQLVGRSPDDEGWDGRAGGRLALPRRRPPGHGGAAHGRDGA